MIQLHLAIILKYCIDVNIACLEYKGVHTLWELRLDPSCTARPIHWQMCEMHHLFMKMQEERALQCVAGYCSVLQRVAV